MKQLLTGLVIGALLVLGGVLAMAYLGDGARWLRPPRTITLTGTATVRVTPDSARVQFYRLGDEGTTIAGARAKSKQECSRIEEALGKALRKFKDVKAEVLKTDAIKVWSAPVPGAPVPPGSLENPPLTPPPPDAVIGGKGGAAAEKGPAGPFGEPPPAGMPPRQGGGGAVYGVLTLFTVELVSESADAGVLRDAAREVADLALQQGAWYRTNPDDPGSETQTPRVTFRRRDVTADRQRALEEALSAARRTAQKLAGSDTPVQVLEVTEQVPPSPGGPASARAPTQPGRAPGIYGDTGPEPGPGLLPGAGPRTALDREMTCTVVVKFAY